MRPSEAIGHAQTTPRAGRVAGGWASLPTQDSDKPDEDQIDGNHIVQDSRHDQNHNPGNQGRERGDYPDSNHSNTPVTAFMFFVFPELEDYPGFGIPGHSPPTLGSSPAGTSEALAEESFVRYSDGWWDAVPGDKMDHNQHDPDYKQDP